MTQNISLAVILTVLASVALAVASVVQHSAVGTTAGPEPGAKLSGGQLLAVIRNPRWLGGLMLTGVGAVLQMAALLLAPVTVVQPIGVLAVPWTILLAARVHKRPITSAMWGATSLTVLGTVAFAWVAIRNAAPYPVLNDAWLVLGTLAGFGIAGLLALAGARGPVAWRCLAWSAAAAVIYGAESGVVKAIGHYTTSRPWLGSPVFWMLAASIVAGMVLAGIWIQQGYASGAAEIVVGTLNAAGPVAGVAYGIAVLGEGMNLTWGSALLMLLFAAVAISGVVLLSRIHPGPSPAEAPPETAVGTATSVVEQP
ncbi:MAG TPA: DMT family transporter [Propionicimonas sp.]